MMPEHLGLPRTLPPGTTVKTVLGHLTSLMKLLGYEPQWLVPSGAEPSGENARLTDPRNGATFVLVPLFHSRNVSVVSKLEPLPKEITEVPRFHKRSPSDKRPWPFLQLEMPDGNAATLLASPQLRRRAVGSASGSPEMLTLPLDARVLRVGLPFMTGEYGMLQRFQVHTKIQHAICRQNEAADEGAGRGRELAQLSASVRRLAECETSCENAFNSELFPCANLATHSPQ